MLAYVRGLLYEGKVLKRRTTDNGEYLINFKGFNSKSNTCTNDNEVLKINDINLQHKKNLVNRL